MKTEALPREFTMTADQAAQRQHLYSSYYTIWLVSPKGEKFYVGSTCRKTGRTLIVRAIALAQERREVFEATIGRTLDGVEWIKKTSDSLHLNIGWKLTYGGTIRQEAGL